MTIAFDSETALIQRGLLAPPLACLSLAWDTPEPPAWLPPPGPDVRHFPAGPLSAHTGAALLGADATSAVLARLLEEPLLVAANAPFDLAVLASAAPAALPGVFRALAEGRISDVQIRERLITNAAGRLARKVNLALLVKKYLGLDISASKVAARPPVAEDEDEEDDEAETPDPWRLRYGELVGVLVEDWPEAAVSYAVNDAIYTLGVYRAQSAGPALVDGYPLRVERPDGSGVDVVSEDRETRAAWALHLMASHGLRTDADAVAALVAEWTATSAIGKKAGEDGGWIRTKKPGKIGSLNKKILQAIVKDVLGDDTPYTKASKTFPEGQVSTKTSVLVLCSERPGAPETLRAYAESLQAAKFLSIWGEPLTAGATVPLTSTPVHLVETGRTSWTRPPLQQPPKKGGVRECIVPRPGYVFCSVDYDSAELRALGQVHVWMGLGDTLARMFREGRDPLVWMACEIRSSEGIPTSEADWTRAKKAGEAWPKRYRDLAKVVMYGFPGGLGASTLVGYAAQTFGVVLHDDPKEAVAKATELKAIYLRALAEQRGVFAAINRRLEHRDAFTAQAAVSGRLRGGVGYCDGCNGVFQPLVADGAKAACWALAEAAYLGTGHPRARDFFGSRPVVFVHDEVIAELPIDRAHEAAEAMAAIMVDVMQEHIPDVPITASPALMEFWTKSAETVRGPDGRLLPWRPIVTKRVAA